MRRFRLESLIFCLLFLTLATQANISGVVFRDFNRDGQQQTEEPAIEGAVIKFYANDSSGDKEVASATTDVNGTYSVSISTLPVRIELELPDNGCNIDIKEDFISASGDGSQTGVQFASSDNEIHDFAVSSPQEYSSETNPYLLTPFMVNSDPLGGGNTGDTGALAKFHLKATGYASNSGRAGATDEAWIEIAKQKQIGSTWGEAYSKQAKRVFVSANLRRHVGLGPLGSGGIYILDPEKTSDQQSNIEFVDLDSLGIKTSEQGTYDGTVVNGDDTDALNDFVYFNPVIGTAQERGLGVNRSDKSNDPAAYGQVGKLSLGDIDISKDGRYLYVVNLYDRKLYQLDLTDPQNPTAPTSSSQIKSFDIPNDCTYQNAGEYRPFALKIYRGKAYLSVTCSGQDEQGNTVATSNKDMKGFIYSFDLSDYSTWTKLYEFTFDYRDSESAWNPWTNKWVTTQDQIYAIPLISDIEFTNSGDMLIGILDIHAHQLGYNNYSLSIQGDNNTVISNGDMVKVSRVQSVGNCQYAGNLSLDKYQDDINHKESSSGGIAVYNYPDEDLAIATTMDPVYYNSQGIILYKNDTGERAQQGYEVTYGEDPTTYTGKANAIGDVEIIGELPPIEIGNRIWEDSDGDGIQDADEVGISDVKVQLIDEQGNIVATTTTDSEGNYIFQDVAPNSNYTIKIDPTQFTNGEGVSGTPLDGLSLTQENSTGASSNPDNSDSDAIENSQGEATISITTGEDGANDYSFDFGFTRSVSIGDRIWLDLNANGIQDSGEVDFNESITVELLDENGAVIDTITTTDGKYKFTNVAPAKYQVRFTIPSGYGISPKNIGNDSTDSDVDSVTMTTDLIDVQSNNLDLDLGLYQKASIGDLVWYDDNQNGLQDAGEAGVENVTVKLLDKDGKEIASTTTDSSGNYIFENLEPADYSIKFDLTSLPADYVATTKDAGDDTKDSDADQSTGETAQTTLEAGEKDLTWDLGIYKPTYSLGDFVWEDTNGNGIQDSGEGGIPNVTIKLYKGDGTYTGESQLTDGDGKYEFTDLDAGDYYIVAELPTNYQFSPQNQGGDDALDSDVDFSGKSDTVTINSENISNLDVGLVEIQKYSLGDFVWEDTNQDGIQDSSEAGISGVKVELFDENGTLIASTTTDSSGAYKFENLANGNYSVKFTPPTDYTLSPANQGGDDAKDSDADSQGVVSVTISDANNFTIDLGVYKESYVTINNEVVPKNDGDNSKDTFASKSDLPKQKTPAIDIEKHTNGKDADFENEAIALIENDTITWEYIISNIGDDTIDDIKVIDDKEGEIDCPKSSLVPGEVMTCSKEGIAKDPVYQSTATVTGIARGDNTPVKDKDDGWYTTKYLVGTHFWIDTNKDGIYQEGVEEPVPNALVELFDGNGNKVAETITNEKGEYSFYVDAGSYYVKFHLPEKFKEKGFIFDSPVGNEDNELNANNADELGFTMLASVGPTADERHQVANLTLDAGINCGCDAPGIEQGSGDSLSNFSLLLMFGLTVLLVFREIERKTPKGE